MPRCAYVACDREIEPWTPSLTPRRFCCDAHRKAQHRLSNIERWREIERQSWRRTHDWQGNAYRSGNGRDAVRHNDEDRAQIADLLRFARRP